MELTQDEVLQILQLLERSKDVEHLEVRLGDTHIVASRSGLGHQAAPPTPEAAPPPATEPAAGSRPPAATTSPAGPPADAPAAEADLDEQHLTRVTAPVVGVFYRAPEPGADPFVEEGSVVDADTTVGLVEVMKTFNSVTAGVHGTVRRILAGNEEFVEYGQPLLLIEPERPS